MILKLRGVCGGVLFISTPHLGLMHRSLFGETACTKLVVAGKTQYVLETPEEILEVINKGGEACPTP